jgi:hypothetical protein
MDGIAFVISSEGAAIPVIQGMVQGSVRASRGDFSGRLYDVRERRIGDRVLMFGGGQFLHAHALGDVDPATAGREKFHFVNPFPRLEDQSGGYLRFIGVSGGVGSEIAFDEPKSEKSYWQGAATLAIERDGVLEGLRVSSGAWFPIEHALIGDVSLDTPRAETLLYSGRITGPGDPPPAVMVFVDNVLLGPAPILRSSEHSTASHEPGSANVTGTFRLELPGALFDDAAAHQVRFFVFSNGRAVELHPRRTPASSGSPGSAAKRIVD